MTATVQHFTPKFFFTNFLQERCLPSTPIAFMADVCQILLCLPQTKIDPSLCFDYCNSLLHVRRTSTHGDECALVRQRPPRTSLCYYWQLSFRCPAAAASVWNSLPKSVRTSLSLPVFSSRLKTELSPLLISDKKTVTTAVNSLHSESQMWTFHSPTSTSPRYCSRRLRLPRLHAWNNPLVTPLSVLKMTDDTWNVVALLLPTGLIAVGQPIIFNTTILVSTELRRHDSAPRCLPAWGHLLQLLLASIHV